MGIAASQARYLYLTARQTNVEFEGQQINQARTNLANEESGLFRKMMEIDTPILPTMYTIEQELNKWGDKGPDPNDYSGGTNNTDYQRDYSIWKSYIDSGYNLQKAYDTATDMYNAAMQKYEKAYNDINSKIESIHEKDQVLELQLRQLDTEQETIVTELESVKKVIDKNIENVFKTFQS